MPTVLIVDDSKTTQMLVMNALGRIRDVRLLTAANGREALEVVAKNELDLVVTDINMPEMDGIALIREVRKLRDAERLPILIITAKAENQARDEGLALGANAYVLKPLSWHELTGAAEKLLARSAPRSRA
jgi:two-component system chemotaxis response regulator CheY